MEKINFVSEMIAKNVVIPATNPASPNMFSTGVKALQKNNRVAISGIFANNDAPAGIEVVTKFMKSGVVVASVSTTVSGSTTKGVFTKFATHTHANIDEFDSYEVVVKVISSTTLSFVANLFVDSYYQTPENYLLVSNIAYDVDIVEGATALATNPIVSSVQLKDIVGNNIDEEIAVIAYVSSDADGNTPVAGAIDVGAKGKKIQELTANVSGIFKTDDTGLLEISMTKATAGSLYLNIMLPNGKQKHSTAIVWS